MCENVNSFITHEKSVNWWLPAGIIEIGTLHKIIITVPQMKQTIKEEHCTVGAYSTHSGPPVL